MLIYVLIFYVHRKGHVSLSLEIARGRFEGKTTFEAPFKTKRFFKQNILLSSAIVFFIYDLFKMGKLTLSVPRSH